MARYRPSEYCLTCGKQLKAIYKDQSDIPLMQRVIGDTFMGYKKCDHKIEQPTPEGKKVEERLFTLEEALKIFDAGVSRGESYINGWGYENDNGSAEHYFKDKFGIDI